MNKNISKYFWDLNKVALLETEKILRKPDHPKFAKRLIAFLSRCQQPRELFSFVSKDDFIAAWPKVRFYWAKIAASSDFRDWWQSIYEQIVHEYQGSKKTPKGKPQALFLEIGRTIRNARVRMSLSQTDLALKVGMKQPDISMIEEGKKNMTLETLSGLCKALRIKNLKIP
jgi:DNA-binding XRE family transcriptional regulator